ncbi:MAG: tRNA (adenosine(37)-N6)-dimethylallyltransferase MiaA [Candidatus Saccharimonadales bacterium]
MSLPNSDSHTPSSTLPLVVVVGETASGKSALAMQLAQNFNGEIICADSRTIYKGMDIGTAKPGAEDQKRVPHHLLDVASPSEVFTVVDFKTLAVAVIGKVHSKGKLPIVVGGTGLYIDAILYDYVFRGATDDGLREELERLSVEALQERITGLGLELPNNPQNPRHLIRTIETSGSSSVQYQLRPHTLVIGKEVPREVLNARISARVDDMMAEGLANEADTLFQKYGVECRALQTIGYQEFLIQAQPVAGMDIADIIKLHTRQYAKRQRTWFRRNKSIHWVSKQIQAVDLITSFLNKND